MKPERAIAGAPTISPLGEAQPEPVAEARPRLRPPTLSLFAQALGLTILSLLSAVAVTVVVIFNLPPPIPDFYRVTDIAQVYRSGQPYSPPDRSALTRTLSMSPPRGEPMSPSDLTPVRQQLGQLIGVRPQDLVIISAFSRFADRSAIQLVRNQLARGGAGQDHFLIAPFKVAVRQPDGAWLTVAPKPTYLPTPWQQRLLLWLMLSLLALIPLAYVFARRLASPIAAFAAAAERLGRDPRAPPIALEGPSEVGVAVRAFNKMQERLARYVDDRTAMIGAIAHDLRTPLTRLRFRLEDVPVAQRAKMVSDINEMEEMISAAIAFVRDATTPAKRAKLELSSLLESLADEMSETGLDVTVDLAERVVIDGDPLGLRRLFTNLLTNAVKFGRRARVRVWATADAAMVEIDDDGPGVPESELERVFEPFYRCEQSRSRESGGIGLGLPVVRSLARAHGGDAELTNRPHGGLTARVTLPLAAD